MLKPVFALLITLFLIAISPTHAQDVACPSISDLSETEVAYLNQMSERANTIIDFLRNIESVNMEVATTLGYWALTSELPDDAPDFQEYAGCLEHQLIRGYYDDSVDAAYRLSTAITVLLNLEVIDREDQQDFLLERLEIMAEQLGFSTSMTINLIEEIGA